MSTRQKPNRLIGGMWTLAGVLALTAVAIRYFGGESVNWITVVLGLFCLGMGISAFTRRSPDAVEGSDTHGSPPSV